MVKFHPCIPLGIMHLLFDVCFYSFCRIRLVLQYVWPVAFTILLLIISAPPLGAVFPRCVEDSLVAFGRFSAL